MQGFGKNLDACISNVRTIKRLSSIPRRVAVAHFYKMYVDAGANPDKYLREIKAVLTGKGYQCSDLARYKTKIKERVIDIVFGEPAEAERGRRRIEI